MHPLGLNWESSRNHLGLHWDSAGSSLAFVWNYSYDAQPEPKTYVTICLQCYGIFPEYISPQYPLGGKRSNRESIDRAALLSEHSRKNLQPMINDF